MCDRQQKQRELASQKKQTRYTHRRLFLQVFTSVVHFYYFKMYTCKVADAQVNFTCNMKNTYQHKWGLQKSYFYTSSREKNSCFKKKKSAMNLERSTDLTFKSFENLKNTTQYRGEVKEGLKKC